MTWHRRQRGWTRREVLATGCATAGTLALGGISATAGLRADDQDGPYRPFKMGLQSYSLRGYTRNGRADVSKAVAVTKELGVRYWESYTAHVPMAPDPAEVLARKRQIADA